MRRFFLLILMLLLAGCNLEATDEALTTPTFEPLPTTSYVAPTPYRVPTLINAPTTLGGDGSVDSFGVQAVGVTPTPRNILTPVPAQVLIENPQPSQTSQNAIEAFVNNLIVPAWNFVYTLISEGLGTMWLFAGARGGVFAQLFCCITPIIVVVVIVLFRFRIIRWRR